MAVTGTLIRPERQSAYPPAEVEKVGLEKPVVLLKGDLGESLNGSASALLTRKAWMAVMVAMGSIIFWLMCLD